LPPVHKGSRNLKNIITKDSPTVISPSNSTSVSAMLLDVSSPISSVSIQSAVSTNENEIYIPQKTSLIAPSPTNFPQSIPSNQSNNEEDDTSNLGDAALSLQRYFFSRLVQVILFLGGKRHLTTNWHTEVHRKLSGQSKGIITVIYCSEKGKKCRSRVEVAVALGLLPTIRSTKTMTRSQFFITAMETRERLFISQHLIAMNGKCDSITYLNDFISIMDNNSGQKGLEFPASAIFSIPEGNDIMPVSRCFFRFQNEFPISNFLFIFGNIGVLSWGRLYPDPAFHTETQLFPIGFKCVRVEHDMFLNTVVGCLCEIDALAQEIDVNGVMQKKLLPVFKITVVWDIDSNRRELSYYVGDTPENVWSKVNSETLGLPFNFDSNKIFFGSIPDKIKKTSKSFNFKSLKESNAVDLISENKNSNNIIDTNKIKHDSAESKDNNDEKDIKDNNDETDIKDENEKKSVVEMSIPSEVVIDKKECSTDETTSTTSLSLDTPIGTNNSSESPCSVNNTPREASTAGTNFRRSRIVPIDNINLFVDSGLMRLIEGMHGALDCKDYSFVSFRECDAGSSRSGILNDLSRLHQKTKLLDKVVRENESFYVKQQQEKNRSKLQKSLLQSKENKKKQKLVAEIDDKKSKKFETLLHRLNGTQGNYLFIYFIFYLFS
jgi:hypothetical protein